MAEAFLPWITKSLSAYPQGWLSALFLAAIAVKAWPVLDKQVADARAQKRAEKLAVEKEERSDLRDRIASLERLAGEQGVQLATLTKEAQSYQLKLVSALSAFRLLAGELGKLDPGNPVLKQANDLIGMATTGDMGMNDMLAKLSTVAATERKPDA